MLAGKPYRTTTQRWSDRRKRKMERRAISMIENRMAQETAELQMFEGWRAASQGCIRDKFRDTVSNNRVVPPIAFAIVCQRLLTGGGAFKVAAHSVGSSRHIQLDAEDWIVFRVHPNRKGQAAGLAVDAGCNSAVSYPRHERVYGQYCQC